MDGKLRRIAGILAVLVGAIVLMSPSAFGQEVFMANADSAENPRTTTDKIEQLEALLDAQQGKIEDLKGRLAVLEDTSPGAARVAEVRKVVSEVLADSSFRESLYPDVQQVGYDKGFYIKSSGPGSKRSDSR